MPLLRHALVALTLTLGLAGTAAAAPAALGPFDSRPDAIIDLGTREGVRLVQGEWRHREARVVEVDFRAPGPDLRPSGLAIKTLDIAPPAGARDFDDSGWEVIDPAPSRAAAGRAGSPSTGIAWR